MRASINVSCAKVVQELRKQKKDIYSVDDVTRALTLSECGSVKSITNYLGAKTAYLTTREFLTRVKGGYTLTDTSKTDGTIMIRVIPGNPWLMGEILKKLGSETRMYEDAVRIGTMEV